MIRQAIIAIASLAALVLFLLGIRKLKIRQSKKAGLFLTTIIIVLCLLGYHQSGALAQDKNINKSSISKNDKKQIIGLVNTAEWQNFKAFWQKLDEIVPNKNKVKVEKELSYLGEYTGAINTEEGNKLEKELKVLIGGLKEYEQKGIVNPVVFDLLERICIARLNYLAHGFSSMMMRMIPPPSLVNEEKALKNLERIIDHLLLLKKKGKVDHDEFTQALANIQEEIKVFSILSTRNAHYGRFYSWGEQDRQETSGKSYNIEDYLASFEKDYSDYKAKRKTEKISAEEEKYFKDLNIKYEETKRALEELQPALPLLNELIADLER